MRGNIRSCVVLLCVAAAGAARLSPAEARHILGIDDTGAQSEQDLKRAFKAAALKAHPDKGGSEAEFVKVSQAYDTLRGGGGNAPAGAMGGEEARRRAYANFEEVLESLGAVLDDDSGAAAAHAVDQALFDGGKDLGFVGRMARWAVLGIVRRVAPATGDMLSHPNAQISINGQTMSGAEFAAMYVKEQRRQKQKQQQRGASKGAVGRDEM